MTPIGAPNRARERDVAYFVAAGKRTQSVSRQDRSMASVPDPEPATQQLRFDSTKHSIRALKKLFETEHVCPWCPSSPELKFNQISRTRDDTLAGGESERMNHQKIPEMKRIPPLSSGVLWINVASCGSGYNVEDFMRCSSLGSKSQGTVVCQVTSRLRCQPARVSRTLRIIVTRCVLCCAQIQGIAGVSSPEAFERLASLASLRQQVFGGSTGCAL